MNMKADSRQQIIPPTQKRVKAGFVVYAPNSEERCIVILNDGELEAREKDSPHKIVFTMHPGDLVGVASLLEREPFKYQLVASRDSDITLITEECMESELTRLPLWLLAVIRSFCSKTRDYKQAALHLGAEDTLRSLAEFLSQKKANTPLPLVDTIQEFALVSRIHHREIIQDVKGLVRRHFLELTRAGQKDCIQIPEPRLLEIFVEYLSTRNKDIPYKPYSLTKSQRQIVAFLVRQKRKVALEGVSWVKYLSENIPDATLSDWLILKNAGCFVDYGNGLFKIHENNLYKFFLALKFETNIKGVL